MSTDATKTCPDCAEDVKAAARVCRFCGYKFESETTDTAAVEPLPAAGWYPDPEPANQGTERYWTGTQWTHEVRSIDVPAAKVDVVAGVADRGSRALSRWRGRKLSEDDRVHYDALVQAREKAKTERRAYDRRVSAAEDALRVLQAEQPVAQAAGVYVYPTSVRTSQQAYPLNAQTSAVVDTAGNLATTSRSTLTRMGVGTLVAGPAGLVAGAAARKGQKIDARELYLLVDGGTWAFTHPCPPDAGAQVRALAQQINVLARNFDAAQRRQAISVEAAQRTLEDARNDRAAIEAAEQAVAELERAAPAAVAQLTKGDAEPTLGPGSGDAS